jgi:hypothetical protein
MNAFINSSLSSFATCKLNGKSTSSRIWSCTSLVPREKAQLFVILLRPRQIPPPLLLLAGHVCGANHLDIGVDEEECDDLAMAGPGWVSEFERPDAVLENVREGEQAAFAGLDTANLLHSWTFVLAPEHLG